MKFMDKAIRLAASHKEKDNYVYRNSQAIQSALTASGRSEKTARALSLARMFGTEKDEIQDSHNWFFYLADRTGEWDSRKDLLDVYLKYCKHVYTKDHWGESAPQAFDQAIQGTESIIRSWYDNRDFALGNKFSWWVEGMMSLAIKESTGKEPDYLYMDVRNPDNPGIVRAEDAVKMDLNARLLNPKWIKALMKEGYAGATVLAKDTGNLMGWEITRENTITDRDWQRVTDVYVKDGFDLGLFQWFEKNNPHAFQDITVTLLETVRKGYWQADEKTLEQIVQAYAQSVVKHGTGSGIRAGGNEKLEQFVNRQLTAPGKPELNALAEPFKKKVAQMTLPPEQPRGEQQVQGKKMVHEQMERPDKTKEESNTPQDHMMLYLIALGILAIMFAGFIAKEVRKK
jgi:cobaltochelatase CobN